MRQRIWRMRCQCQWRQTAPWRRRRKEGADDDGHEGSSPSPGGEKAVQGGSGAAHPYSAPCSPSGSRPGPSPSPVSDHPSTCKTSRRSSSLSPSSPLALRQNECVCDSAFCPAEHGPSGMQRNTGTGALKTIVQPSGTCPWVQKSLVKREREDGTAKTLSFPSDDFAKYKKGMDVASYVMAQDDVKNDLKNGEVSVKKETTRQNLLLWSVADVATYFSAAGFPEQAVAFRTQEIDGKSLLLMQRSDVLTGLSIRLGPALKIYERHVKVLQRTHFLDEEDDL
ncbi:hypothetical protein J4Q44_G00177450 [Coregonus suidteri]|uniref:SAM domain-containing protein n=1 Tax=Coregonus suidteri TaxID=861788 RepID=A0AAN8QUS9_9TELE